MAITSNTSNTAQKSGATGTGTFRAGVPQLAVSFGNPGWNELVAIYAYIQKEYYAAVEANLATVTLFGSLELALTELTVLVRGIGSRLAYLNYRHFADLACQRGNVSMVVKYSKCAASTVTICQTYDAPVKAMLPALVEVLKAGSTSAQVSNITRPPQYSVTLLLALFSIAIEAEAA